MPRSRRSSSLGQRLRVYMPYGELIPGMAYLVRRLLENTSNDSFLRAGFVENVLAGRAAAKPRRWGTHRLKPATA